MSTILIHKQTENSTTVPANKYGNRTIKQNMESVRWEDLAGLSWVLLEKEEEY